MARRYIFADEAGDLVFKKDGRTSKYFIICTACLDSCDIGTELLELRRSMAWDSLPLGDYFHASEDKQIVRDIVFEHIKNYQFTIQATIMEKSKALPRVRQSNARFYKYGWFYHLQHVAPQFMKTGDELLFTTASIGTKKGQAIFTASVNDVVQQIVPRDQWKTFFCPCAADPCLQIVDYCTWAIQKKWERNDTRSYDLIKDRVTYEYDLWARGNTHHY